MDSSAPLPTDAELLELGIARRDELHAGHQSRVFAGTLDGRITALKFTERRFADPVVLERRMELARAVAEHHAGVVAPRPIAGELVRAVGGWLLTATPFVEGMAVDAGSAEGAASMGRTLAALHAALAAHDAELTPVSPLRAQAEGAGPTLPPRLATAATQALHGDFSDLNLVVTHGGLRILDFDDAGIGPREYDLANSVYMVLFDAHVAQRPERLRVFAPAFLDAYDRAADRPPDRQLVDDLVEHRIEVLGHWLDDPSTAPIGVRTATEGWRTTLRGFVAARRALRR